MESIKKINVGKEFSETPIGRYRTDSDYSGQVFREDVLLPALRSANFVEVNIDETEGYGSSFLDEAFGGLLRNSSFTKHDLHKKLKIVCAKSEFKIYEKMIWHYIDESSKVKK